MVDRRDSEMTDAVLRAEIELLADLMAAVSDQSGPLSDDQVDAALGLRPPEPRAEGGAGGTPHSGLAS